MKNFFSHKKRTGYLMVLICFILVGLFTEAGQETYGAWSLLPPAMLFAFAILTKSVIEGFIWAGVLATFMIERGNFFTGYMGHIQETIMNADNVYLIMIFLEIGIFIAFLKKSGAAGYFANFLASKTNNSKILLLIDWVLGIALSVDEYMAGFTIGAAMTPVNDGRKIPREMTAYTVRSVNVNPAVCNPLNAWAIFIATTMESIGFAAEGKGISEYMHVIPFLFFPIITMLISLLVILGVIPKLGGIKKAYARVEAGGPIGPEGGVVEELEETLEIKKGVNLLSFIVPIVALVGAAFYFDFDMVNGIMAAIVIEVILYVVQGIIKVSDIVPFALEGIVDLVELTTFLVIGMTMSGIVGTTGFTEFIVGSIAGFMTPWALPVVIFVAFSITEYLVTFNWTLYLLAMPSVVGLAAVVGCNPYLAIAALVCAGVFGSNASFLSDNGVLVASACKIDLYEQNISQLPYMVISVALSAVAFLAAGIVCA